MRGDRFVVRPAEAGDRDELARVHVVSWQEAYRGLLPQSIIASRSLERRRSQWQQLLANSREHILVIGGRERLLGFSNFGRARDDDLPSGVAEVYALYLDPGVWRRGFGGRLWQESIARLAALGHREVAVWSLEKNSRALGFYRSRGLEPDGWRRAEAEYGEQFEQIRLRGPIAPP